MTRQGLFRFLVAGTCTAATFAELPVQPGDIAFGLSTNSAATCTEQIRPAAGVGVFASRWTDTNFIQSFEFDNFGGIRHNANGNLLALDLGTLAAGGEIWVFSTDGSDTATQIGSANGLSGNPLTRAGGLGVSPDNTKLSFVGFDDGRVHIYSYNAGGTVGTGLGASCSFLRSSTIAIGATGQTAGTTWLDNNTVLAYVANAANPAQSLLYTIDANTGAATLRTTIAVGGAGNQFTDVEYNPDLSNLIICSMGRNSAGVTTNQITFVNSTTFATIDTVNTSTSSNTAREISFGTDRRLYISTFNGTIESLVLDVNGDLQINATDAPLVTDNSTLDYYDTATASSFNGIDAAFGVADSTGACCLSEISCVILTEAQCGIQAGIYRGGGTTCDLPNICRPVGACCVDNVGCISGQTPTECINQGGTYEGDGSICQVATCFLTQRAVEVGDVILGANQSVAFLSTLHLRDNNVIGSWDNFAFIQSVEFDNLGGELHSNIGNLLGLDFGAGGATGGAPTCGDPLRPQEGAGLYNLSTNGADAGQLLYRFNTLLGGVACTRASGVGVSPDNAYISIQGVDTGDLYVLTYDEGATPGTGAGASIGAVFTGSALGVAGVTQGTTWLDNDTILLYTRDVFGDPFARSLRVIPFNGAVFGAPVDITVSFPVDLSGSTTTDVDYNPNVSPYIYCMTSAFSTGVTTNYLAVIDPSNPNPALWNVVKLVDLSTSMNTSREIALGPDGLLYMGEFAGGGSTGVVIDTLDLDPNNDGTINLAETLALADNSSVDYYQAVGLSANFTGLDVAHGVTGPVCGPCADSNCDGFVTVGDIGFFVDAIVGGNAAWAARFLPGAPTCDFTCANDTNNDGFVTVGDIASFVTAVSSGIACP
ncbi:MAG: hypothetical protein SF069_09340 [Phycisphaerae bacterium]|nr:hypothetical protein [Phycisphaerae bacterium]